MHAAIESQRVAIVRSRCQRLQSGVQGAGGAMCTQLRLAPHCIHLAYTAVCPIKDTTISVLYNCKLSL